MTTRADIARVLRETAVLLLDFDGPICKVFATKHDYVVAQQLRDVLADSGAVLPPAVRSTRDPLEVLRFAATSFDEALVTQVDDELRRQELDAVTGARPTPHVGQVIQAAARSGRRIGIVSNNSSEAIKEYVAQQEWAEHIDLVIGRSHGEPHFMKPHPRPVWLAYTYLDALPYRCALVGDSVTDIEAAQTAKVKSIGFANRPDKAGMLSAAGADAVIASMDELLPGLIGQVASPVADDPA